MGRFLFVFIGGFTSGIAFRSFYNFGFSFSLFLVLLGFLLVALSYSHVLKNMRIREGGSSVRGSARENGEVKNTHYFLSTVSIFILAMGFGILRFDFADSNKGSLFLDGKIGEEITVSGVVVEEPDVRETHTKLTVEVEGNSQNYQHVDTANEKTDVSTDTSIRAGAVKILIITEQYPEFQYGDEVTVRGKTQKPKNFTDVDDGIGRQFNYVAYLEKDGIFYQMFYPEIERVAERRGNEVKHFLFDLKVALLQNVAKVIPEPHSALWGGITLGVKRALGEDLLQMFRDTGIIHIVVLSGYNITIVAEAVGRAASFLPRLAGIAIAASIIPLFAIMTGGSATIVRASVMALLVLLARATGRLYEITIALFVAGFIMLLWNPKILLFDPSFQLSFLATIGLLYIAPSLERFLEWVPQKFQFRGIFSATVSTQLFVLPLLVYMMGEVSLVSLPVNLLILMFIPFTMFFGFMASVTGFFHEFLSLPFAFATYALLEYELKIVELFSSFPFASITTPSFSLLAMLTWYLIYACVLFRILKKS